MSDALVVRPGRSASGSRRSTRPFNEAKNESRRSSSAGSSRPAVSGGDLAALGGVLTAAGLAVEKWATAPLRETTAAHKAGVPKALIVICVVTGLVLAAGAMFGLFK